MPRKYTLQNRGQLSLNKYGKTVREMSPEELKEYMRIKKAESRNKPDVYARELKRQNKYYYDNVEKQREKCKEYYYKHRDEILAKNRVKTPFGNCLPIQMFGCHEKEMTQEQKRQLHNKRVRNYYYKVLRYKLNNV